MLIFYVNSVSKWLKKGIANSSYHTNLLREKSDLLSLILWSVSNSFCFRGLTGQKIFVLCASIFQSIERPIFLSTLVTVPVLWYCHKQTTESPVLQHALLKSKWAAVLLWRLSLIRSLPRDSNLLPNTECLHCSSTYCSYVQVPGQTDKYLCTCCACLINKPGWITCLTKFNSVFSFKILYWWFKPRAAYV